MHRAHPSCNPSRITPAVCLSALVLGSDVVGITASTSKKATIKG
jgi:hypothetical protein